MLLFIICDNSKNVIITPVIAPNNKVPYFLANLENKNAAKIPNKLPTIKVPTIHPITTLLLAFKFINPALYGIIITNPQTAQYANTPRVIYKNFDPQYAIIAPKISSKNPINLKNLFNIYSTIDKSNPQPCSPLYEAEIEQVSGELKVKLTEP